MSWLRRCCALVAVLLCALPADATDTQPRTRGVSSITEQRLALVIGNAAYRVDPLDNSVNDARLVAGALRSAGFDVALRENLDRGGLLTALRDFGSRLGEHTVAVLYYAGHGLQLRDRNYLLPVEAEIRSEDEIPIAGIDLGFILGRMSFAKSRVNIVILDACRNNPFAGKTVPAAQKGLAQMDAPIGTLLAFATAPGKVAADGTGAANGVYAQHIAKHLPTPGLPVELMFKRVREGVVRDTQEQQVPWESSSLQGEFAFVPGVGAANVAATPAGSDVAAETAFWNTVQHSTRAEEYRAYLRQYPQGRFVALAQLRLQSIVAQTQAGTSAAQAAAAAAATTTSNPATVPTVAVLSGRPELLPRTGDTWRYRVQDRFRLGDLFVTARVDSVGADGIAETWTTTSDAKVRTAVARLGPAFHELPGWELTPPEFAPYLQASGALRAGQQLADQRRRVDDVTVPLRVSVEGEEELVVAAGRFRAVKLVLRGQAQQPRGAAVPSRAVSAEHVVWYAPEAKRIVKAMISTKVGASVTEATVFELVEYRLN